MANKKKDEDFHKKTTQKLAGVLAGFQSGYGVGKSNSGMMQGKKEIDKRYK